MKSTADNSSAVAPQKILTFRDTEMLFYALWIHKGFFHVKMA